MRIEALRYLSLYSVECTTADKENILGIDVNIILVRMLTASLWRYIYHRAFQQLEQALLYSLTAHIAGDRRIVALAGNLVYLVNKHDTFFCSCHIIVGHLEQTLRILSTSSPT